MKEIIKLPFDIKKAKNGAKVVTRSGKSVRIICYDKVDSDFPLIGLIRLYSNFELICTFTPDGLYDFEGNTDKDLFIEEEVKEEVEEEVDEQKHQFKPFDRVLVRDFDQDIWKCNLFSHVYNEWYYCVGCCWHQCIPYEGNEHLVGTADSPKIIRSRHRLTRC